jgi:tight adherence protein C
MPVLSRDMIELLAIGAIAAVTTAVLVLLITTALRYLIVRARVRKHIAVEEPTRDSSDLGFDQARQSTEITARISLWVETIINSPRYGARVRQKLLLAGIFNPHAVGLFLASRVALAVVLPVSLAVALQLLAPATHPAIVVGFPMAVALLGLFLPDYYVSRRTRHYEEECRRGFPDFLDLLVIATDAGMGMEQAIGRVGKEIIKTYPAFGANLYLMTLELRMGRGFGEALAQLVARTNVAEIKSFATLLQQSRELGASVTAALRVYSEDMRHKRMSNAEEKAQALPVKIVIPLGVFLFPVIILIVMLPVVVRIIEAFNKFAN